MTDPIYIEKAFHSLQSALSGLHSKRERLFAINDFLQLLSPHDSRHDTYRDQIKAQLPEFYNVYEITGIDPAGLETILLQLKNQFKEDNSVTRYLESLEDWVSIAYQWVGKKNQTEQRSAVTLFDSQSGMLPATHTVLVPVVENRGQHATGRLRNLTVKTIGQTPASKHELTQVFSVLAGSSRQESSSIIQNAVNQLLLELKLTDKKHWQVTASFEHNDAWHSGNSADLAMGGLFFCALLEAMELKEQFRLNPAIAITGELSKTGEVKEVAAESIRQKVEAAFFSWTQVLVVPQSQLGVVYKQFEKLKEKYPKRELLIIGVQHVRDLFYDRRLTIHTKKGTLRHVSQKLWKRKFSAISVIGYLILASIIAALVIGPVDRNPDHFELLPNEIVILNKVGRELKRFEVDPVNIYHATLSDSHVRNEIVKILDIDNDNKNEVLLSIQDALYTDTKLLLLDNTLNDTLWINELVYKIDYKKHPDQYIHEYRPRVFRHADIDHDGDIEIIATMDQQVHFQGHVWILDAKSGELEQSLKNSGGFLQIEMSDIDEDGFIDLITCGHYKGFDLWGCTILDGRNIEGFSPLSDRYWDNDKPIAPAKLFVAWESTVLRKALLASNEYQIGASSIFNLRLDDRRKFISLQYIESRIKRNIGDSHNVPILFTFDYRFNPVSFASTDYYDSYGQEMYEKGYLPFLPSAQYLHAFKDSLLYWNGNDWVNEPTLNPAFLESVGDDSTYYKEWYFKKD